MTYSVILVSIYDSISGTFHDPSRPWVLIVVTDEDDNLSSMNVVTINRNSFTVIFVGNQQYVGRHVSTNTCHKKKQTDSTRSTNDQ